jgi:hemolysin D
MTATFSDSSKPQDAKPSNLATGLGEFDQPTTLEQSNHWSRAIAWTIMGATTLTVAWAAVFQIDESVPATGKLEPEGAVKEIQAPVGGVVKETLVKDGQRVKRGDVLVRFDTTAAAAQVAAQTKIREALIEEIAFYKSQLQGSPAGGGELATLVKGREAIAAENELLRAQLSGSGAGLQNLQQQRLNAYNQERNSRINAAQLEAEQARSKLDQTGVQLVNARETLAINQKIFDRMQNLVDHDKGIGTAISMVQYDKQHQEVLRARAQVEQLEQEQQRLNFAIDQAEQKVDNTTAQTDAETLAKISSNDKSLADTDSQAAKVILENQKRIAEIDSQISKDKLTLQYQELRAPVDGTIFDLKAGTPGYVANSTTPVMKIVPQDTLVAKVFIANKDIGFVKPSMQADVRFESFPYQEFGDVAGELSWIGSDALPPEQIRPYYHYPAKIKLNKQFLTAQGKDLPLQAGMAINTQVKIRKRTILSIFTEPFLRQWDAMKGL